MACARCPYTQSYTLLWQDERDPDVKAVMLRCCAGPELQIRRGADTLFAEIFKTRTAVLERSEQLRADRSWESGAGESAKAPTPAAEQSA
ncbi:MAG: hypothetical protein AB7G23_16685 [Vicinamibacterales bacterium]